MTYEEALKRHKGFCEDTCKPDCEDECVDCSYIEAMLALEKQIPKKPDYYEPEIEYSAWVCPACGEYYKLEDKYENCHWCGQAIDWED